MGSDNLKWLDQAVEQINASTAKIRAIERKMVAGYEFVGGSMIGTEQHSDYRAKLDEIHALALKIKGGR
jgi:hypothetical protein